MNKIATFTNDNKDFTIYANENNYEVETVVWDDDRTEREYSTTMYLNYEQLKNFVKEICSLKAYFERMDERY